MIGMFVYVVQYSDISSLATSCPTVLQFPGVIDGDSHRSAYKGAVFFEKEIEGHRGEDR